MAVNTIENSDGGEEVEAKVYDIAPDADPGGDLQILCSTGTEQNVPTEDLMRAFQEFFQINGSSEEQHLSQESLHSSMENGGKDEGANIVTDRLNSGPEVSSVGAGRALVSRLAGLATSLCCSGSLLPCLPSRHGGGAVSSKPLPPRLPSGLQKDPCLDDAELPSVGKEQLAAMSELFPKMDQTTLALCLGYHQGDLDAATDHMRTLAAWRSKHLPISFASVAEVFGSRKLMLMGNDRRGHPVLLFEGVKHVTGDSDANVQLFTYFMEQALQSMETGVSKIMILMCLDVGTPLDLSLISGMRTTVHERYPGRIWRIIIFPTGIMTGWLWSLASCLLDEDSQQCIRLLPPEGGLKPPQLLDYIAEDQLLEEYGGSLQRADLEARWFGPAKADNSPQARVKS